MINFELIEEKTFEDYNREVTSILRRLNDLQNYDKTGLLIRILNFDRGWLFGCFGKVLDVSQTSNIQNRDELSFFESILHFFNYHIYDDGGVCIKYEKYDINSGSFKKCNKNSSRAKPFIDYAYDNDKLASESDILKMLDEVEKMETKRIKSIESSGFDDEPPYKKDYINYII
jgi:hypothetical protein